MTKEEDDSRRREKEGKRGSEKGSATLFPQRNRAPLKKKFFLECSKPARRTLKFSAAIQQAAAAPFSLGLHK